MRKLQQGDFVRLNNDEIPRHIELLQANGYNIWERQWNMNTISDDIIIFEDGTFNSDNSTALTKVNTELTKHDWVCTVIGLEPGMGMRSDMSTPEQRKHVTEELHKIGVKSSLPPEVRSFKYSMCFKVNEGWIANDNLSVHISYSEWCKALNIEPIHEKGERYPMGTDQPAQIDCRLTECAFHSEGTCNNVSPAITLNPNGHFTCWSKKPKDGSIHEDKNTIHNYQMKYPTDEEICALYPNGTNGDIDQWCRGAIFMRDYIKSTSAKNAHAESIVTFPNGPDCKMIDLSKPIQASFGNDKWDLSQEYHFIGLNRDSELVVEGFEDADIQVAVAIRNTPEPEFKEGDLAWHFTADGYWTVVKIVQSEKDDYPTFKHDGVYCFDPKLKPYFNPDGTPNFPPFND